VTGDTFRTRIAPRWPVLGLGLVILAMAAPEARAATVLFLDSQPGDYVGAGLRQTFTTSDGAFTGTASPSGGISVSFQGPVHFWNLTFAAPTGVPLPGAYDEAHRAPFRSPTHAGLDVFGDGRGCNILSGRFVIHELVVNASGNIMKLAADFEQHCENATPALFGSIRLNSTISIEPRIAVADRHLLEGDVGLTEAAFTVFLTHPATVPVTVSYATADGTALAGTDYFAASGTLTFAPGTIEQTASAFVITNTTAQPDRSFTLGLSNPTGAPIGAGTATALIMDDDSGRSLLYFDSQRLDYIGGGVRQTLTVLDGSFTGTLGGGHAEINFRGEDPWTVDMAAPSGSPLVPGVYENAERWPFQPPGVPGLSISGAGRGCNTLTGRFVVQEVAADGAGHLQRFAADFEQHCEGASSALFGSIRLNSTVPPTQQTPVAGDFNGDGATDILWRNEATGANGVWFMSGGRFLGVANLVPVPNTNWKVVGTADFNADGQTDLLWRNAADGRNAVTSMNGISFSSVAVLPTVPDSNWRIVATGEIDADARPDILWRNGVTGQDAVWMMTGTVVSGAALLPAKNGLAWTIVGAGDLNGDGQTDICWRNLATGDNLAWLMAGTALFSEVALVPVRDGRWVVGAIGDFNGDGRPDILWRNAVTGANLIFLMNGTRRSGVVFLPSLSDSNWKIVGPK
jgi:hypothetical protein